MARKQNRKFITAKGTAIWPHLHAPDTKFDKDGTYSTKIQLSARAAAPLIEAIDEEIAKALESARAQGKGKKIEAARASYDENEDGSFTFNFKMKASGTREDKTRWERKPVVFDAMGAAVPEGVRVGGGSTIKVACELSPYYNAADRKAGVSLRLEAVQVIELVQFGARTADAFGFDVEEGGFSAEGMEPVAPRSPFGGEDEDEGDDRGEESVGKDDDF